MNKKWLMMLLPALIAGCSSNDEPISSNDNAPVKIEIGTQAPTLVTKAAVERTNWVGQEVVVWGLSKNAATNWLLGDGLHTSLFADGGVTGTIADGDAINFSQSYYYPDGENAYTFYGYYPNEAATLVDNKVAVTYTLTGKEDILYGKEVAADVNGKAGYNAAYFREDGAVAPTISFAHKLTRFTFEVKAGNEETIRDENQVQITSIRLLEAKNNVTLNIADKNNGTADGTLTVNDGTGDFVLSDTDGTPASAVTATVFDPSSDVPGTKIGESIMAVAGEASYKAEITIKKVLDDTSETVTRTIKLVGDQAFVAGSSYRIKLTVYGFTEVTVSASLEEWQQGEEVELPTIH